MRRLQRQVGLLVLLGVAAVAHAQTRIEFVPTFSTSARVRQQMERMDRLAKSKLWDEWLNAYQQLVDDPRELVMARDDEFLIGVRHHCHQLLAALPPEARQRYRILRDNDARKLFDTANKQNDPVVMRDVYSRYRFTSFGPRALQWLADRALDEGRLEYARTAYSRLAKEPGISANMLLRYAMAADGSGHPAEAREALERVRKQFGALPVQLAGQQSTGSAAAAMLSDTIKPAVPAAASLTSYAGEGLRNMPAKVPGSLRKLWSYTPQAAPPPSSYQYQGRGMVVVSGSSGSSRMRFSFMTFPAIRGDDVWFQGPRAVTALELGSGKKKWEQDQLLQHPNEVPRENTNPRVGGIYIPLNRPVQVAPVVDGNIVVLRAPLLGGSKESPRWPADHAIMALDARTGKQLWRRVAGGDPAGLYFNAPAVHKNIVFTGVATHTGGITEYRAVALDLGSGEPLWSTYLGAGTDALVAVDGSPAAVRDGLVWIESSLYTLNALDLISGEIRLIYRYSPGTRTGYRRGGIDSTPSVSNEPISLVAAGGGPIVFAPRWGTDVVAIDPQTLKLLWTSPKGRDQATAGVLFAVDGQRAYICGNQLRAISLTNGEQEWTWDPPASGSWVGYAALCGDRICVPVDNRVHVLGAADRKELAVLDLGDAQEDASGPATVVAVGDKLLVSTKDRLTAFGPK